MSLHLKIVPLDWKNNVCKKLLLVLLKPELFVYLFILFSLCRDIRYNEMKSVSPGLFSEMKSLREL